MKLRGVLAQAILVGVFGSQTSLAQEHGPSRDAFYAITVSYENESKGEDGSSSSSRGANTYTERLVSAGPDGTVTEYDIWLDEGEERPLYAWQFPFRVQKSGGSRQLLNQDQMLARRDVWLEEAKISPEACGKHVFTWNVFKIECDPETALGFLDQLDIQVSGLPDEAVAEHPMARESGKFVLVRTNSQSGTYSAELAIDPDKLRQDRAESALVIAEIMGEELSFEEALAESADVEFDGTIVIELETDIFGDIRRRTTTIRLEETGVDGLAEQSTSVRTVDREERPQF